MIVFILFVCLITLWVVYILQKRFSMPHGPLGLPFIGYSLNLEYSSLPLFKSIDNLSKKYGRLFSFGVWWNRPVVVLANFQLAKEALLNRSKEFSGRTTLFVNGALAKNHGISNYDGPYVDQKKKIIQRFLRMNDEFESIIDNEVRCFMNFIEEQSKTVCSSRKLFSKAICNIIWKVVFDYRFEYSDSEAFSNVEKVAINNSRNDMLSFRQLLPNLTSKIGGSTVFTVVKRVLGLTSVFGRYLHILDCLKNTMTQQDKRKQESCQIFRRQISYDDRTVKRTLTDEEKLRLLFELFAAGTDTTILSLQWASLLLAVHPEIQDQMRKEVADVLGYNKDQCNYNFISWNQRDELRYCNQVLAELHRYASVTPLALPHRATSDINYHGYTLPKDSIIILAVYSIHNDPAVWKKPHEFNPDRFNGLSLTENILPFSMGKRSCPGAQLAQAELFTILVNLICRFHIEPADPSQLKNTSDLGIGTSGLTRAPKDHSIIFRPIK